MTNPITDQDKLKLIVAAAVKDDNWEPWAEKFKKSYKQKLGEYIITVTGNHVEIKVCTTRVLETVSRYGDEVSVPIYDVLFTGSLPDLISDKDFMKVFGKLCRYKEMINSMKFSSSGAQCNKCDGHDKSCRTFLPVSLHYAIGAIKLLHKEKGDAINYLYDNMGVGDED